MHCVELTARGPSSIAHRALESANGTALSTWHFRLPQLQDHDAPLHVDCLPVGETAGM
jgi:hypothetical protein